jgi:hypothetical protein
MNVRSSLFVTLSSFAISSGGCKLLETRKSDADAGVATTAASDTAMTTPTASGTASGAASAASAAVLAKAPATSHADAGIAAAGKQPLTASAKIDRIPRNRDKDGPCPTGFAEQPGVENHSVCARVCKTEADCHGHTCEDSDIGNGKVCTETASKKTALAPKCKPDEFEDGNDCLKGCTTDKDCPKKGHCEQMKVPNPNGGVSTAMVCR